MSLFNLLIPRWAIFGVIAAALLGVYGWHVHAVHTARVDGMAEVQGRLDAYITTRVGAAAAAERDKQSKEIRHAKDLSEERTQRAADRAVADAAAAANRRELLGLRNTNAAVTARLVQALTGAGAGPGTHALAAASGDVLGQCQEELVGMGEQAEDLAVRLRGLQTWARSAVRVCGPDSEAMPSE